MSSSPTKSRYHSDEPTRVLYVNNLPRFHGNRHLLRELFEVYGEVSLCCYLSKKREAFIHFYDLRAAIAAFSSLGNTYVWGRKIKISYNLPRVILYNHSEYEHSRNNGIIFVRYGTQRTREYVLSHFSQFGLIRDVSYVHAGWRIEYYNTRSAEFAMVCGSCNTKEDYIHSEYIFTGPTEEETFIDYDNIAKHLIHSPTKTQPITSFKPIRVTSLRCTAASSYDVDVSDYPPF